MFSQKKKLKNTLAGITYKNAACLQSSLTPGLYTMAGIHSQGSYIQDRLKFYLEMSRIRKSH